jgi:hypothetical protein
MSQRAENPDTPQGAKRRRALVIGAIVALLLLIAAVALLRGSPEDLAVDPEPSPDDVDAPAEDPADPADEGAGEPPEEPPADDAGTAIDWAAGWIVEQVDADGAVEAGFSGPAGNATQAALALAAAGTGEDEFTRAVTYVVDNHEEYVAGEAGDSPGALGYVLLLADAAGEDPRDFGGTDLVERLRATERTDGDDAGLYGEGDPDFDGAFRQSLALLGLAAAGEDAPPEAIDWLLAQQCEDGGFTAYRAPGRREGECDAEEDAPDTNSTALAIQALAAHGVDTDHDPVAWLEEAQNDDGGFGFGPGFGDTDTNSTGVVLQALAAAGEDPLGGRWTRGDGADPVTALLRLQIGCDGEEGQRGAFAFQPEEDGTLVANPATYQAVWGLSELPFPLGERDPSGSPAAC